ncbi:alpha/beta-hydrolase [Tothia fuscella]|uniref:cutinase n=1 Tax=Tothia fuscella TaxID=1048955 RepID=A0A9P4U324_9PEZI|nr:alpha/beta-hydrolase [Tothia fuscella]
MLFNLALLATIAPTALVAAAPSAGCASLLLVYARATGEPAATANSWSKGYGAAGYSLLQNITKAGSPAHIEGSDGYPVNYPAGMGTQNQGTADLIRHMTAQMAACPQQKYALGGHSQGGFAVVDAVPKMNAAMLSKVVAITMFGSPACPGAVKGKCISFCNQGDTVCSSRPGGAPPGVSGGGGGAPAAAAEGAAAPKMPKMPKMPKGGAPKDMGGMPGMSSQEHKRSMMAVAALPDCATALTWTTANKGKGGHMTYNSDGLYVREAACYIKAMYSRG